jgi:hypothetical protein
LGVGLGVLGWVFCASSVSKGLRIFLALLFFVPWLGILEKEAKYIR